MSINIQAGAMVGLYLLEDGGLPAVQQAKTLVALYRDIQGGNATLAQIASDANLDAAAGILGLLTKIVTDAGQRPEVEALIKSLPTS